MLIDNPSHYQSAGHHAASGNVDVITVIKRYGLGESFDLGNVAKYLLRAGKKGATKSDLDKALWYARDFAGGYHAKLWPMCGSTMDVDASLAWMMPDEIVAQFGLTGTAIGAAVEHLLDMCVFDLEENVAPDTGQILAPCDALIGLIEAAIAALPQTEA